MLRSGVLLSMTFSLLFCAWPLSAHHSFAAEYDSNKTISIKGTVAKIAWVNPHAYVYINAKDASGTHPLEVRDHLRDVGGCHVVGVAGE